MRSVRKDDGNKRMGEAYPVDHAKDPVESVLLSLVGVSFGSARPSTKVGRLYTRHPGWNILIVYMARTTIAPSRTSAMNFSKQRVSHNDESAH